MNKGLQGRNFSPVSPKDIARYQWKVQLPSHFERMCLRLGLNIGQYRRYELPNEPMDFINKAEVLPPRRKISGSYNE